VGLGVALARLAVAVGVPLWDGVGVAPWVPVFKGLAVAGSVA